jgi:hypothetical protein
MRHRNDHRRARGKTGGVDWGVLLLVLLAASLKAAGQANSGAQPPRLFRAAGTAAPQVQGGEARSL